MLSLSCADPWPEGSVGVEEEEVVTAAAQAEERDSARGCSALDDSLTSLQWLQEFSILGPQPPPHRAGLFGPQPPGADAPSSPLAGDPASLGPPLTPGRPTAAAHSRMQVLPGIVAHGHCPDEVDYKTNAHIKPPYSYATLICMAMEASNKSKITLSYIYQWITGNFCYYRHADPTWQNSIRHNLSLNKWFIKVPRQKDEPGKGGFWRIDPQYAERLLSGANKKRRLPPVQINPALQSRLRVDLQPRPPPRGPTGPVAPTAPTAPTATTCPTGLGVSPETQRFLWKFEEETATGQSWDPHLAEGTMLGSWLAGRGRGGPKRRPSAGSRSDESKVLRRQTFNLLSVDEQKDMAPLKGDFDWDALLNSALSGELSLDGEESLIPIMKEADLTVRGTHISPADLSEGTADVHMETRGGGGRGGGGGGGGSHFDEETFLAAAFLESPWPEEEDQSDDFLCSANVNLDQLFDLDGSLGVDPLL